MDNSQRFLDVQIWFWESTSLFQSKVVQKHLFEMFRLDPQTNDGQKVFRSKALGIYRGGTKRRAAVAMVGCREQEIHVRVGDNIPSASWEQQDASEGR